MANNSVLKQVNEALVKFEAKRHAQKGSLPPREYDDVPVIHLGKDDWHCLIAELSEAEGVEAKLSSVLEYNGSIIVRSISRVSRIQSSDDVPHKFIHA
jgi:hypothetical protein